MAATLYCARHLLPIDTPAVEGAALLVEAGRIHAVGTCQDLAAAHPRAAVVDFGETVILPPLVNAHTHLELSRFPQWAAAVDNAPPPTDFVDWVLQLVQVRRQVAVEEVRTALTEGLRQCLRSGTGAIGDILTTLAVADAYAASPLRGRVFAEVLGVDEPRVATRLTDLAPQLAALPSPALAWGLSPHAPYTLSAATRVQALAFARGRGLPLAMHWAESAAEGDFLARGEGPLVRLYAAAGWPLPVAAQSSALDGLPAGSLLIHGVHAGAAAIAAVAAAGLGVVLCPRSNARFGAERAPVAAYRHAGVPLALGTDSLASSPSLSVWEELAFARQWFAGVLDPLAWLEIATAGGAAALGLGSGFGRLAPGGEACFQVVAVPAGATAATLPEALCAAAGLIEVRALFLNGENVLPDPEPPPIIKQQIKNVAFPGKPQP
jgi:cytosine/adenosine deaminase-related metal-dependent hydrolase